MEENKASAVKQTGDDSGYSCTSTRSKNSVKSCHSQSASSGDSCFEERRSLTTLKTTENRKISTLNSKSSDKPNKIIPRDLNDFKTTTNQEINNLNSNSEQINLLSLEPQMDQFHIDELKQPSSVTKLDELDDSNNLNDTVDHDRNNAFLQLATLCQSYHDYLNTKNISLNSKDESLSTDTVLNELNDQELQLKEIIESNELNDDSFGVIVSMHDGLIVNTSNSIHKSMGYPKDMWQGRSFIDFIHSKDRISFISHVTSVLTDPYTVSRQDDTSTVTFFKTKNNDGFYCNIRKYRGLNTGYSISPQQNHYQVCKLIITLRSESYTSTSSSLIKTNNVLQPQLLLIIKAQLINSAYTYPDERKENPLNFITKHNALFEWCYVDHLIISHFGYLPQNIIGRSIFAYYNIEDLATIKEIHENMTEARSVPYKGKPYRFKCQNGDFALVQTEWSNFVNPWSERVEFVIGRHKVIQGPTNPDVTTPVDDIISEIKIIEDKKNYHEIYEDIKKILNKTVYKTTDITHNIDQTTDLCTNTNVKQQLTTKYKDSTLLMNCQEGLLEMEVQPETCGRFSDRDSVMLGEISPHHNYESKSSSGTPPSYTQLNYNDNIQRFFKSNLKTNSSEYLSDGSYPTEVTNIDTEMNKVQHDTFSLHQNVTPTSSIINHMSTNYYSENNSNQNSQLTQKMLLRHNKKMEDDLVKQHKNNSKKIKSCEKQKHLLDEIIDTPDVIHGIKRSNPNAYENKPYKLTKRNHLINSIPTNVNPQKQEKNNVTVTHTVTKATQIWPPCQITRDSQATDDLPKSPTLPSQVLCYNVPLSNNVMPVKHNPYENMCTLMNPREQNQELLPGQLQPLTVPLYATIPVMNHIPQNSLILQPYLHYHNQLLLQQPYQNVSCENKINPHNENQAPKILNTFYQNTKNSQVNQEEVITSSDSECIKEIGSLKSSSGWMYEDSSFYSSSLRDKTDISSEREECSWPPEFNITNNFRHQFIKKKPFWVEDVITTPDLIYRYQMEHKDLNEVLRKDMNVLNTLTQPLLVNEQLKQLYVELDVNGASKTYMEDGTSSSSGGDECLISIGKNKKRKIDFCRMAMIYEENAPLPPPASTLPHTMSSSNQSTA